MPGIDTFPKTRLAGANVLVVGLLTHVTKEVACNYGPGATFKAVRGGGGFILKSKAGQAAGKTVGRIANSTVGSVKRFPGRGTKGAKVSDQEAADYISNELSGADNWTKEGSM